MHTLIRINEWQFNHTDNRLYNTEQSWHLEQKQSDLLAELITHYGKILSKEDILDKVWRDRVVSEEVIYVAINALRKALGDSARHPKYIKTIPGKGYCFLVAPCHTVKLPANEATRATNTPVATSQLTAEQNERYQKACFLLTLEPKLHAEAKGLLEEIIRQQPKFGPTYIQLANAMCATLYTNDPTLYENKDEIEALYLKGLALNPDDSFGQQRLATLYFLTFRDYNRARYHFHQSLPSVDGHYHFSQFLLAMGEFDSALEHLQRYITLYSQGYSSESVAWVYTMSGEYERGLHEIEKLRPYANDNFYYHVSRQAIFELLGDEALSMSELLWLMAQASYDSAAIAAITRAFEQGGLPAAYFWLCQTDQQHFDIGQYTPPISLARYAVSAGLPDLALDYLEQAQHDNRFELLWVGVDPKYNALHSNPRFKQLITSLGLPRHLAN